MSRWLLEDTLTGAAGDIGQAGGCGDGLGTVYFFTTNTGTGAVTVYSWSPVIGFTDISGGTFQTVSLEVDKLALFGGELYARVTDNTAGTSYIPHVYKWSGGTSWTAVWTGGSLSITLSSGAGDLETDGTKMVLTNRRNGGIDVYISADGSTWTAQTANGGAFPDSTGLILGTSRDTLSNLTGGCVIDAVDFWQYAGGNDWQKLNAGAITVPNPQLAGYAGDEAWIMRMLGVAYHSTDWGVTATASGGVSFGVLTWVHQFGFVILAMKIGASEPYVYDAGGDSWGGDGEPVAGGTVILLFNLVGPVYALVRDGDDVKVFRRYAGYKETQVRLLGLAADEGRLYLSGNADGTLKLWTHQRETWLFMHQVSAGAATFVECTNRTRGIFPVVKPGNEGIVLVRGRDGSDRQALVSEDAGASLADVSDAGWAGKYAAALLADLLAPDDWVAVFSDDDIYRTRNSGNTWAKTADAPVVLREAARHWLDETDLILAGQSGGAGQLFFSPNYGQTAQDVSDAGIGVINAITVSL